MKNNWNDSLVGNDINLGAVEDDIWGNKHLDAYIENLSSAPEITKHHVQQLRINEHAPETVVKFGHPLIRFDGHFLKILEGDYGQYYRCNGPDCLACRAGFKKVPRRVEFFFHPTMRSVVYRSLSESRKPDSFDVKLRMAYRGGFPAVLMIFKKDSYNFAVKRLQISPEMDLGVETIQAFLAELKDEKIDFYEIIPEISNDELALVPGVEMNLIALGVIDENY